MLDAVVSLSREAGKAILQIYDRDFEVWDKDDKSPLTEADLASHEVIVAGLAAEFPDIPVLSEESKGISTEVRRSWRRFFLVDPLDGTKEFMKRNGEFTVNIALIEDGEPVLGVVYAPVQDVVWAAERGKGAFRAAGEDELQPIHVTRFDSKAGLRVVGSRSHASPSLQAFLAELEAPEMVPMGSSLKLCLVAEGSADVYPRLGPTCEWDTAAAHCVVAQAGGTVTDLEGAPLQYNKDNILNPYFMVLGGCEAALRGQLTGFAAQAESRVE